MLVDRVASFADRLRSNGVPVSTSELIDACRALEIIDWSDRTSFKTGMGASLIKNTGHLPMFDVLFELYFPSHPGEQPPDPPRIPSASDLRELIAHALARMDEEMIEDLASQSIHGFAGMEPGRPVGGRYYAWKVEQALDIEALIDRLSGLLAGSDAATHLSSRLLRDEAVSRVEGFRSRIERLIRSRLVRERGPEAMARALTRPLPEEADFLQASSDELAEMKRSVTLLARRMAARLSYKHRQQRQGRLDFRRTIRASLQTGGAPADPKFRHRTNRPDIVVLCDVSGSVAAFSRFTLILLYTLGQHFRRVRSFAFIDAVDEVSSFFEKGDPDEAVRRVKQEAKTVWMDGHSDYGNVLGQFAERHLDALGPKTTVLLLGDARSNFRDPKAAALQEIRSRSKRVWMLNPEPRRHWDTGDSIVAAYEPYCDGVFECRNLRQLGAFIERLA